MRKETAKVLIRMALWTVPLVLIVGGIIAAVLIVALLIWPDL